MKGNIISGPTKFYILSFDFFLQTVSKNYLNSLVPTPILTYRQNRHLSVMTEVKAAKKKGVYKKIKRSHTSS